MNKKKFLKLQRETITDVDLIEYGWVKLKEN